MAFPRVPLVAATTVLVETLVAKLAAIRNVVWPWVVPQYPLVVAGRCSCVEPDVSYVAFIVAVSACRLVFDCLTENGFRFEESLHDLHAVEVVIFCPKAH